MAIAFGLGGISDPAAWDTLADAPWAFVIFAALIFLTRGEIFSLFPSTCTDTFGTKFATVNLSLLYTAKGTSAFLASSCQSHQIVDRQLAHGICGDRDHEFLGSGFGAVRAQAATPAGDGNSLTGRVRTPTDNSKRQFALLAAPTNNRSIMPFVLRCMKSHFWWVAKEHTKECRGQTAQGNVISAPRRHPLRPFLFPCSISSLLMTVSSVVEWRIRHTMKRDARTRTESDARRSALMAAAQTGDRVRACDVRRRDGDVASHERDTRHVARGLGWIATTVSAAFAAFELSLPDRSRAWALLPLPAAALWVGASGLGCMRACMLPGTHFAANPGETRGLPAVHYRPVGAAVSGADRHAAARLFAGAAADGGDGGPRIGSGGGYVVEFLRSFRRHGGRPCRARRCGGDCLLPPRHSGAAAREPTGLSSLGVGSSPSGVDSLLARYPETWTSATQTYPPVEPGARRRFGCAERA